MDFGSYEPSTTPRATSSATTSRGSPSASISGASQTARRPTVRPPSRRSAEAAIRTIASRSSLAGSPAPTASTRPAGVWPAAASEVAKSLALSSPKEASERSSPPTLRSSSSSAPSKVSSSRIGITRTSVATSQGWSTTTRRCTMIQPPARCQAPSPSARHAFAMGCLSVYPRPAGRDASVRAPSRAPEPAPGHRTGRPSPARC